VPAYQQAIEGDYALIRELQEVMTNPYAEQSKDVEDKYYRLKPREQFEVGGPDTLVARFDSINPNHTVFDSLKDE